MNFKASAWSCEMQLQAPMIQNITTVLLRINTLPRENAPLFLILFYKRPLWINAPPPPPPPPSPSYSLRSCGLNLNTNGSEDGLIHCFKEGEPCQNGREQLISQLDVLDEPDRPNPFDLITESRRWWCR